MRTFLQAGFTHVFAKNSWKLRKLFTMQYFCTDAYDISTGFSIWSSWHAPHNATSLHAIPGPPVSEHVRWYAPTNAYAVHSQRLHIFHDGRWLLETSSLITFPAIYDYIIAIVWWLLVHHLATNHDCVIRSIISVYWPDKLRQYVNWSDLDYWNSS